MSSKPGMALLAMRTLPSLLPPECDDGAAQQVGQQRELRGRGALRPLHGAVDAELERPLRDAGSVTNAAIAASTPRTDVVRQELAGSSRHADVTFNGKWR
jgi:hypothetical protein